MRQFVVASVAALGLASATPVLAQQTPSSTPPSGAQAQSATPAPSNAQAQSATPAQSGTQATPGTQPAPAQSTAQATPDTRPGHTPGVGTSEPSSTRASNILPSDTHSTIAPTLPVPPVAENASPERYLEIAKTALNAGRTGEAQEALERAESRLLDRATSPNAANEPDTAPRVRQITAARDALGRGDRSAADAAITQALAAPGQPTSSTQ